MLDVDLQKLLATFAATFAASFVQFTWFCSLCSVHFVLFTLKLKVVMIKI